MHCSVVMQEEQSSATSTSPGKLHSFARNHPIMTVIGLGGIGLIAGPELLLGVVIGGAAEAIWRRQSDRPSLREKSRALIERVPHTVRERARAVVAAARGEQPAPATPAP